MNKYEELKKHHQQEFSAVPMKFAFGTKQFNEMMEQWNLDPDKDLDKIVSIVYGGYIREKDVDDFIQTQKRHAKEMNDAIAADKTGDGFIYEMFYCELCDHEYGYTRNPDSALEALGYTYEALMNNGRLLHGFEKAKNKIIEEENKKK